VGKTIRSPQPEPKVGALDVKKRDDRSKTTLDVKRLDDTSKANSASAGASATGRQKAVPLSNTKIAVLDGRSTLAGRQPSRCRLSRRKTRTIPVIFVMVAAIL
jgi:hypothetical protein